VRHLQRLAPAGTHELRTDDLRQQQRRIDPFGVAWREPPRQDRTGADIEGDGQLHRPDHVVVVERQHIHAGRVELHDLTGPGGVGACVAAMRAVGVGAAGAGMVEGIGALRQDRDQSVEGGARRQRDHSSAVALIEQLLRLEDHAPARPGGEIPLLVQHLFERLDDAVVDLPNRLDPT
jgi:hypothetical protein